MKINVRPGLVCARRFAHIKVCAAKYVGTDWCAWWLQFPYCVQNESRLFLSLNGLKSLIIVFIHLIFSCILLSIEI